MVLALLVLQVNLRHLRESVALLSARLRQHTAAVRLTRELQDLTPQVRSAGLIFSAGCQAQPQQCVAWLLLPVSFTDPDVVLLWGVSVLCSSHVCVCVCVHTFGRGQPAGRWTTCLRWCWTSPSHHLQSTLQAGSCCRASFHARVSAKLS